VTGYGGYTQRAESPPAQATQETVTIRLDTNTAPGLGWRFKAEETLISIKIGENRLAIFRAENRSGETVTGTATFNVTPEIAGAYFNKIECFCFQEQTLAPGESMEFPVSFFVDPSILEDRDAKWVREITLSYTFFRTPGKGGNKAAANDAPDTAKAQSKTGG
jgi:cytochrome c oxidase assembly protein subunit 11